MILLKNNSESILLPFNALLQFAPTQAVAVAQLVERSLPIPEVRSSNPDICKKLFILNICLLSTVY